jgi:diadenylate cyclase
VTDFLNNLLFIFQRFSALSAVDVLLVTIVFYALMYWLRDTQAMVLLRGVVLVVVALVILTSLADLPGFAWLVRNSIPAVLLSIPVVFAPEIRRALERIGRAGTIPSRLARTAGADQASSVHAVVEAARRLSARQHGALIVLQGLDHLEDHVRSGVRMNAAVSAELLLQIFYPNTPLHDGAAIIAGSTVVAAACVLPLSSSGILNRSPDRQLGLRHRAALGISEESDAISIVVSEETGAISLAQAGELIRRIEVEKLENLLLSRSRPPVVHRRPGWLHEQLAALLTRKRT